MEFSYNSSIIFKVFIKFLSFYNVLFITLTGSNLPFINEAVPNVLSVFLEDSKKSFAISSFEKYEYSPELSPQSDSYPIQT